jgi:hypothetical protein
VICGEAAVPGLGRVRRMLEERGHPVWVDRIQQRPGRLAVGIGEPRGTQLGGSCVDVVVGMSQLRLAAVDQEPKRAWPALVWHSDGAGIYVHGRRARLANELPVRMTADHDRLGHSLKRLAKHRVGRGARQDLVVRPRRAVAVVHMVDAHPDRPGGESVAPAPIERPRAPGGSAAGLVITHRPPSQAATASRSALPLTQATGSGRSVRRSSASRG